MGYTNIVDEGSRNPERHSLLIFFISLLPPLFCELSGIPRIRSPTDAGDFRCGKRGQGRKILFKTLSQEVQILFILFLPRRSILNVSGGEGTSPAPTQDDDTANFLSFSFSPLFHKSLSETPAVQAPRTAGAFCSAGRKKRSRNLHSKFKNRSHIRRKYTVY